jgi:hypothetical protein
MSDQYQTRSGMIFKSVVSRVTHQHGLQYVQAHGMRGKILQAVANAYPHGFRSWVKPIDGDGSGAVGLSIEVSPDMFVTIPVGDPRCEPEYAEGDSVMFDYRGQHVRLREDGIHISGKNVLVEATGYGTDGVVRIKGRGVELFGSEYMQDDVAGYGKRRTYIGGNEFFEDSYTTGAVVDGNDHGFSWPNIPFDHPVY